MKKTAKVFLVTLCMICLLTGCYKSDTTIKVSQSGKIKVEVATMVSDQGAEFYSGVSNDEITQGYVSELSSLVTDTSKEKIEEVNEEFDDKEFKGFKYTGYYDSLEEMYTSQLYNTITMNCSGAPVYNNELFLGYIVVEKDKTYISGLAVTHDDHFISVLGNYISCNNLDKINYELPIWEKKKIKELNEVAEEISMNNCSQFNILNYEDVLLSLLNFKTTHSNLFDGSISFEVSEYGKFKISVKNNRAIINSFNGKCDIKLSHLDAMQFFFSPFGSYLVSDDKLEKIISSWFPIPLFISTQDKV